MYIAQKLGCEVKTEPSGLEEEARKLPGGKQKNIKDFWIAWEAEKEHFLLYSRTMQVEENILVSVH